MISIFALCTASFARGLNRRDNQWAPRVSPNPLSPGWDLFIAFAVIILRTGARNYMIVKNERYLGYQLVLNWSNQTFQVSVFDGVSNLVASSSAHAAAEGAVEEAKRCVDIIVGQLRH